jgi:hypothetical protein
MKAWLLPLLVAAMPASAQPIIIPLQPQREPARPPASPVPVAPPQAGPTVVVPRARHIRSAPRAVRPRPGIVRPNAP